MHLSVGSGSTTSPGRSLPVTTNRCASGCSAHGRRCPPASSMAIMGGGGLMADRKPRLRHALARCPEGRRPRRRPAALGAPLPATRAARASGSGPDTAAVPTLTRRMPPSASSTASATCGPRPLPPTGRPRRSVAAAGDHHNLQGRRPRPTSRAADAAAARRILDEAALDGPGPGGAELVSVRFSSEKMNRHRARSSGEEDSRSLKPFRWNPAGNQSRPVELDQQPEASLAWRVGDHPCEA